MTIKQHGGIFGRNPTFNDLSVDSSLNVDGTTTSNEVIVNGDLSVNNNTVKVLLNETDSTDLNTYIRAGNGQLRILTADDAGAGIATLFRIDHTNGDALIDNGNLVISTSGKGIDFSATSGTGTSELFDDYEEGTWTPTFTSTSASFSYTNQYGSYVKIGGFVSAQFYLNATASGTTSNQVKLSGLPFASANLNGFAQSAGSAWFTGTANVTPLVSNNAATAVIWKNNTAASNLNAVDVSGHYFVGTVFYRAS